MSKTNEEATEEKEGGAKAVPNEDGAKRSVHRKPIWVCVPVEFEEVAVEDDDGNLVSELQPTKYSITRCEPKKKAVLSVLARHEIDTTNIGTVIMFRADPMEFDIGMQMNIRW